MEIQPYETIKKYEIQKTYYGFTGILTFSNGLNYLVVRSDRSKLIKDLTRLISENLIENN